MTEHSTPPYQDHTSQDAVGQHKEQSADSASAGTSGADDCPELRYLVRHRWAALLHWLKANTFAPEWLPAHARHLLIGYLLAALLVVCAVLLDMLLVQTFPSFGLSSLLALLVIVLIALTWGAGQA